MSWSLTSKAPKAGAAQKFLEAHQAQSAWNHEPHRAVMGEIVAFAASIAGMAPDGVEVNLTSNGHIQDDGHGSLSVQISFWPAVPAT